MTRVTGAISCDVDTLAALYKGRGCRTPGGYSYDDFRSGLERFDRLLEVYRAPATLFMVGADFAHQGNHRVICAMAERGHEIGNHTATHAQGFRLLPDAAQEAEIAGMEDACAAVTGQRPVGFRAPGWNMSNRAIAILARRGYLYDSSVHPTSMMPALKLLHRLNTRRAEPLERTTLGHLAYMTAPVDPYRATATRLDRRGDGPLIELPVTVVPIVRLPFFATFLVNTGARVFDWSLAALRSAGRPIQFQFHLSDFADYTKGRLSDEVPTEGSGLYVSKGLRMPLDRKIEMFQRVMDRLAETCDFVTLREWAVAVARKPRA